MHQDAILGIVVDEVSLLCVKGERPLQMVHAICNF